MIVKREDIKQGKTFYLVDVHLKGAELAPVARIKKIAVASKPLQVPFEQLNAIVNFKFWHFQSPGVKKHIREIYLDTVNVIPGAPTLCRLVYTMNQAKAYAERVEKRQFISAEHATYETLKAKAEKYLQRQA